MTNDNKTTVLIDGITPLSKDLIDSLRMEEVTIEEPAEFEPLLDHGDFELWLAAVKRVRHDPEAFKFFKSLPRQVTSLDATAEDKPLIDINMTPGILDLAPKQLRMSLSVMFLTDPGEMTLASSEDLTNPDAERYFIDRHVEALKAIGCDVGAFAPDTSKPTQLRVLLDMGDYYL